MRWAHQDWAAQAEARLHHHLAPGWGALGASPGLDGSNLQAGAGASLIELAAEPLQQQLVCVAAGSAAGRVVHAVHHLACQPGLPGPALGPCSLCVWW